MALQTVRTDAGRDRFHVHHQPTRASAPGMSRGVPGAGGRGATPALALQLHYARLREEEVGALHSDMARLDEPYWDVAEMRCAGAGTWSVGARAGGQWVGVASICRQQPPGSRVRGFVRIHGVAVRATDWGQDCATGLIERGLRYIASQGGRTVWCPVPLDTIHIWRRCGFAIAGPPAATRSAKGGKHVWVLMMRRLALARAGLD